MKIFRDLSEIPKKYKNTVITLGNFDGLHLGHRSIISKAKNIAQKNNIPLAMMTFEPHPREFFSKDTGKNQHGIRIYDLRTKLSIVKSLGVECVFLTRFNDKLTNLSADDFIKNILVDTLHASHIVTGENFCFGKNREGNKDLMAQKTSAFSFSYTACPQVTTEGHDTVSSSTIRKFLAQGDMKTVAGLLCRSYQINGRVKHGEGRGKSIGFPTANLSLNKLFLPRYGVYAVRVRVGRDGDVYNEDVYNGDVYNAVANLGEKPTFGINAPLLEVHLLNNSQDLYRKRICVEFIDFIRDEQKFSSISELQKQIGKDCKKSTEIIQGI